MAVRHPGPFNPCHLSRSLSDPHLFLRVNTRMWSLAGMESISVPKKTCTQSSRRDAVDPGPGSHRSWRDLSRKHQVRWRRPELPGGPTPPAPRRCHPRQTKPSAALRGVAGGRRRAPGRGGPPRSMRAHNRAGPPPCLARTGRPRRVPREHARRAPGPAPPGRPSRSGGNLKAPARAGSSRRVAPPAPRGKDAGRGE